MRLPSQKKPPLYLLFLFNRFITFRCSLPPLMKTINYMHITFLHPRGGHKSD